MAAADAVLPEVERRLHRALLEGLLTTGVVPTRATLVAATGIAPDELPARLDALATADYLAFDAEGRLICLYPLSSVPTPHIVTIGEWRRYAMCAIDALGMAAMLSRAVAIDGRCANCGAPIVVDVQPGAIARAAPPEAVVVARLGGNEPALETCCPFTVFACHPDHGRELVARMPGTSIVPLFEALMHAETLFGDLLADTLPARRRRSWTPGAGRGPPRNCWPGWSRSTASRSPYPPQPPAAPAALRLEAHHDLGGPHATRRGGVRRQGRGTRRAQNKAAAGAIDLWLLDEHGFAPTLPTGSTWGRLGRRVVVPYQAPQGRRLNAVGALAPSAPAKPRLVFPTRRKADGRYDASAHDDRRARPCVIVLDNSSVHRSQAEADEAPALAEAGVSCYSLPPDSPELNPIEPLWRQVKSQDIPERSHPTNRAQRLAETTSKLPHPA